MDSLSEISWNYLLLFLLDAIAVVCIIAHVLLSRRESTAAAAWIFLAILLPLGGAVIYVLFGINHADRRANRQIRKQLEARRNMAMRKGKTELAAEFGADDHYRSIVRNSLLMEKLHQRPLVRGNRVEMLIDGSETYEAMFRAMEAARSSIHIEVYILADDDFGMALAALLSRKAAEGIEVRVLYDAIGSLALSNRYVRLLEDGGVRVSEFGRLSTIKRGLQVQLRNHRKITIVDGLVGFTGGINMHAENSSKYVKKPLRTKQRMVRDYHFEVRGPVVDQMQEVFAEDWYAATGDLLSDERYFPMPEAIPGGGDYVRVITSGPGDDLGAFARILFSSITAAEREITIVTPYFYPDAALRAALINSALGGLSVRLILPVWSDHKFVSRACHHLYEEMLESGVRIFHRELPFIHSKAIVLDRHLAFVGSSNLDQRSLALNYEMNLEIVGESAVHELVETLEFEISKSREIKLAEVRRWPWTVRAVNSFCALFSPIL